MSGINKSQFTELSNANQSGRGSLIRDKWRDLPEIDISEGKKYGKKGEKLDENMPPIKGRKSFSRLNLI